MARSLSACLAVAAACLVCGAHAGGIKEPKGSKVSVLNKDLFPRFIAKNPLVLMEFYAPWCGHCQELAPKYREAAAQLAKKKHELPVPVKLAKLDDGDEYNREGRFGAPDRFNYTSYPALFVFKDGAMDHAYYGGRETDEIVFYMEAVANGLDPEEEDIKRRPGLYRDKTDKVIELEPEIFNHTVTRGAREDNTVFIVEFYSDRCPFCKSLSPEIITAAGALEEQEPRARIAALNSRVFPDVAERFNITGWPWVAAFYNGIKVEDMRGLGGAESVIRFAKEMVGSHWTPTPPEKPSLLASPPPVLPADAVTVAVEPAGQESGPEPAADGDRPKSEEEKSTVWRAHLGRQTWFLLHTMAAKYPDQPSEVDQRTMRNFVASLAQHYPCKLCRKHLREKLQRPELGPVAVENRTALGMWFCKLHNIVNVDTGKPEQECSPFKLDLQYLKDCGECEPGKPLSSEPGEQDPSDTFDARLYAKDAAHLMSEMEEAMEALSSRVDDLEEENARLRALVRE